MTQHEQQTTKRRGKGQTLVEFAITFPILLILMFGIIEFGRIFQAWVTLQNSARVAARYATTGQFDSERYVINTESGLDDPDSVVPCVLGDNRGTAEIEFDPEIPEGVLVYKGQEGLYATWYQGEDCEPNIARHQERREDMVRILSIFDQAYIGASGLALAEPGSKISPATFEQDDVPVGGSEYQEAVNFTADTNVPWYMIWVRPTQGGGEPANSRHEGYTQRAYFDVMICSDRGPENGTAGELDVPADNPSTPEDENRRFYDDVTTRFATVFDVTDPRVGGDSRYAPVCLLNEMTPDDSDVDNVGVPWIDPGGPGDPITIVVTFNHPLVTPLGISPYIQLQARRTAINESFREADSVTSLPFPAPAPGGSPPDDSTSTPTDEVIPEPRLQVTGECDIDGTYVFTVANIGDVDMTTQTRWDITDPNDGSGTVLETGFVRLDANTEQQIFYDGIGDVMITVQPIPGTSQLTPLQFTLSDCVEETPDLSFDCDLIEIPLVAGVPNFGMRGSEFAVEWVNNNVIATQLTSVTLNWQDIPTYPGMLPAQMSMARTLYWINQNSASPDPITVDSTTQGYIPGVFPVLLPGVRNLWAVSFANGPSRLSEFLSPYAFNGTQFIFENPEDPANPCVITLDIAPPTITPTRDPALQPPTSTPTPACLPGMIEVQFDSFDIFGVVRVKVINRRNVVATMTGFDIQWIQRAANDNLFLAQVRAGGSNPETGTLLWSAGAAGQDSQPSTRGRSDGSGEGVWSLSYNFQPNTETFLWLDFNGGVGSSRLDTVYLASLADYNGSSFTFITPVCEGSAGGPGSITTEDVIPNTRSTPRPTNTSAPPPTRPNWTNTPRPPSQTPRPPTATPIQPTQPPPTPLPPTVPPNVTIIFGGGGGGAD
jgi:hypothetical protein